MKAAVVIGNNDIRYMDIPEPEVTDGLVKVAVKYCGVCGSDIPRVLNGACHSFPQVLGHEFSGIVVEVASNVTSVSVGDHVVGIPLVPCMECEDCKNGNFSLCKNYSFIGSRQQGAMAEYVVVPAQNVYKIDSTIPLDKAALFEPSSIALHGILINDFYPDQDDVVCVFGAGTIALFTIAWCRILGAKKIIVVGRNRERLSVAKHYGATDMLSTLDTNWLDVVMALTQGRGAHFVFDAAGTGDTIKGALMVAANKANVCLIGTPTQSVEFSVKQWELLNRKELHLSGSWMSYSKPWPGKEWSMTAEKVATGELTIGDDMIYTHYSLERVNDVFKEYEVNSSAIKGRVIIDI